MLFNSYEFILLYLPVVLLGYFMLARFGQVFAAGWLAFASLFFYGYWNPAYVGLLLGSVVCNYAFGTWIAKAGVKGEERRKKWLLLVAVVANLLLLAYYKYANFFLDNIDAFTGTQLELGEIILPLGISFFTFTQIAFLVDTSQGKVKEYNFVHYTLFVTYFPHLIAGPVLHHKEMMPQFAKPATYRFSYENMAVGTTIFFIGLFKKVILADGLAEYVAPTFGAPAAGEHLTCLDAWSGALCYTLQLYFDFSGYSDMAIGLSRMFGVTLPLNFHSPYKSVNIIEFWRRWHMTLSRFLRDYLYIPLGGNRKGKVRRYVNMMTTMLLGGLWHGAGWTFVVWGSLHGLYLIVNHGWQALRSSWGQNSAAPLSRPLHMLSVLLTFAAVVAAWVFFRADNIDSALAILKAMSGFSEYHPEADGNLLRWVARSLLSVWYTPRILVEQGISSWTWIGVSLAIIWLTPNTQQIMRSHKTALEIPGAGSLKWAQWQPTRLWLAACLVCAVSATLYISSFSTFIYFQF